MGVAGSQDGDRGFPSLSDLPLLAWIRDVAELTDTGLSRGAVRWKTASGRWREPHPGIYVTHSGPIDWPTRAAAAVLAATRPSVSAVHQARRRCEGGDSFWLPERRAGLGGWAAAHVDGLTAEPPDTITLVIPRTRVITVPDGCDVIRSDVQQLRVEAWPPRTTIESTIIFLATTVDLDGALALIGRGLQQRRTTMRRLAEELGRWPRHTRRGVLAPILTSDADGGESALELRWVRDVERRHAVPRATRQVRQVIAGVGRRYDVEYDDARLRVELDGFLFHDRNRSLVDRQKSNATTVSGRGQLRYGWSEVTQDPCGVAAELIAAATARGARWPVRPCRKPECAVRHGVLSRIV